MSMKNLILTTLLLSATSVFADWTGGRNTALQASRPPVIENVSTVFSNGARYNLATYPHIRNQLQGFALRYVTVTAHSTHNQGGFGRITLLPNGVGAVNGDGDRAISAQGDSVTYEMDPRTSVFGVSLQSLQIAISGDVFIDKVVYNFVDVSPPPPYYGIGEVVEQTVSIENRDQLVLNYMNPEALNLGYARKGQAVHSLSVTATKNNRNPNVEAKAQMFINDRPYGLPQSFGPPGIRTRLTFSPPITMKLHQEIHSIGVVVTGDVLVEHIAIDLAAYTNPGGEKQFESSLDQRVYNLDNKGIGLTALLNSIPDRLHNRIVDSVVLVLKGTDVDNGVIGSDVGGTLRLCPSNQTTTPPQNCGGVAKVGQGNQIITLVAPNLTTVAQTTLFHSGMINVQTVIIYMK